MSAIVRTSKDVNVAEGDFAKKLREALEEPPRGGEIALRREMPEGVATTITFALGALGNGIKWDVVQESPKIEISFPVSFVSETVFSGTIFGKAVIDDDDDDDSLKPGSYLTAEQIADFAKRR